MLLNRLNSWSDEYEKLSNCQFGFQKKKSTVDCIFILNFILTKLIGSGKKVYTVFLDYEKCFDRINRSFMLQKMIVNGVSNKMVNAIKAMYKVVKAYVRHNTNISDSINSSTGVKQGDPSSPLLAMMFMNDIVDCINTDIEGLFSIDELKLFILMYADDQVIFSTSPSSVQSMLNDIQNYCNTWGLKINLTKTKAMIFEKGNRHTTYKFYLYGKELETVTKFKYLGVYFFKNVNWYRSQKHIAEHAGRSMYKLFSIFNKVEIPISQKCKLFDSLISPVLNYSAEIWGMNEGKDIELIHNKFCRRILSVRKSTNITALTGELGRFPFSVIRKLKMIKYWIKLLQHTENSLCRKVYEKMKEDADINVSYNDQNWACQIKSILESHGMSYIWLEQSPNVDFKTIQNRIFDVFKQTWYTKINNSQRLLSYCRFKHDFVLENYLDNICIKKFRFALSRFRISSHSLKIESGRYENVAREDRKCKNCNLNAIESEFHFLLVCPLYREIRKQYFKPYFCRWPTLRKFDTLMCTENKKTTLNVAKFIYYATQIRQ